MILRIKYTSIMFMNKNSSYVGFYIKACFICFLVLGDMRICKAKSELKNKSRIEVSARKVIMNCIVLDGCAMLWLVS